MKDQKCSPEIDIIKYILVQLKNIYDKNVSY